MKTLGMYTRGHKDFPRVCAFARDVYRERLTLPVSHFPEILFAIHEGDRFVGCIGLNTSVRFSLFKNDPRVLRLMSGHTETYAEQSLLALQNCSIGLPALITVAAAYAESVGIERIVCAAVGVSRKTIRDLGLELMEYGPIYLDTLPPHERAHYATWHALHNPIGCTVSTARAIEIYHGVMERFSRKLMVDPELEEMLASAYA